MQRAIEFGLAAALTMFALLTNDQVTAQQDSATARPTLHPYTARYNVRYHGISGGDIEVTLKAEGNGRYLFRSHLLPNFLGSLFTSDQAEDSSELELTDAGLRPLKFRSEDGSKNTDKDISLDFDWAQDRVKGHANGKDFEMKVPKGTQERLSIQLAASLILQADRDPGTLTMLERDELQQYTITRKGKEHITTAAGDYDTAVLNSERIGGSSRSTRYWYAEKLGYVVVRAERLSHGKVDIVMELKSVKMGE
jgi:hypothetical protein